MYRPIYIMNPYLMWYAHRVKQDKNLQELSDWIDLITFFIGVYLVVTIGCMIMTHHRDLDLMGSVTETEMLNPRWLLILEGLYTTTMENRLQNVCHSVSQELLNSFLLYACV